VSFLNHLIDMLHQHAQQPAPQQPQANPLPYAGAQGQPVQLPNKNQVAQVAINGAARFPLNHSYGGDQGVQLPPDITYSPTQMPYSAPSKHLAQLGNLYTQYPMAPQWKGVDPSLFGYPADNTTR
jgi:hypothetical protein